MLGGQKLTLSTRLENYVPMLADPHTPSPSHLTLKAAEKIFGPAEPPNPPALGPAAYPQKSAWLAAKQEVGPLVLSCDFC